MKTNNKVQAWSRDSYIKSLNDLGDKVDRLAKRIAEREKREMERGSKL